jgi:hypothetical protein
MVSGWCEVLFLFRNLSELSLEIRLHLTLLKTPGLPSFLRTSAYLHLSHP